MTRGQDPDDRRRYAQELTGAGRERLAYLTRAIDGLQAAIVAEFGSQESETELHTLIQEMLAPRGTCD